MTDDKTPNLSLAGEIEFLPIPSAAFEVPTRDPFFEFRIPPEMLTRPEIGSGEALRVWMETQRGRR